MKIGNLLEGRSPAYHAIGPQQPLTEAVALMMRHRIGALVVVEVGGPLLGIVSERDVMGAIDHFRERFASLTVAEVMSSQLVVCQQEAGIEQAMELMMHNETGRRVRHLPVMEGTQLVGVISIGDLVGSLLERAEFENRLLKGYIKNWPEPEHG